MLLRFAPPRAESSRTKQRLPRDPLIKIRVINPNTGAAMTTSIGVAARAVAAAGTVIEAVQQSFGAASTEDHHDDV